MYDMIDTWKRNSGKDFIEGSCVREYVRPFLGTSCIMIAPESNLMHFMDISHARAEIEDKSSECETVEVYIHECMWIYCRHKQADSGIVKADRDSRVDFSIKEVCSYFGMDFYGVQDYLNSYSNFSYIKEKKSMGEKLMLQKK